MNADVGWSGPAGTDGVEQGQLRVGRVYREGADGAFVAFARPVRLIGRIEARAGAVHRQAAWAGSQFIDTGWGHRAGGALYLKEVNATAVARRQIHLGRQHIAERRAEGA